jgi:excisionase family DNA binding protein
MSARSETSRQESLRWEPSTQPPAPRWWDLDDVCQYIGRAKETVREYVDKGLLPAYKLGNELRFKQSDVDAMMQPVTAKNGKEAKR